MPDFFPQAREIVQGQQARRDAWRQPNALSGLALSPPRVQTVDEVAAELEAREAEQLAFRRTPRGAFITCIEELADLGYHPEADQLRGIHDRSLTPLNGPDFDIGPAVGAALVILAKIDHSVAREGSLALAEMLLGGSVQRRAA